MDKPLQQKIKVTSLHELRAALEPFTPMSTSTVREMLVNGFQIVRRYIEYKEAQLQYQKSLTKDDYRPATNIINIDDIYIWKLDKLIENRLDGKRKGMYITWELKDGTYIFDPTSGKLDKYE